MLFDFVDLLALFGVHAGIIYIPILHIMCACASRICNGDFQLGRLDSFCIFASPVGLNFGTKIWDPPTNFAPKMKFSADFGAQFWAQFF